MVIGTGMVLIFTFQCLNTFNFMMNSKGKPFWKLEGPQSYFWYKFHNCSSNDILKEIPEINYNQRLNHISDGRAWWLS